MRNPVYTKFHNLVREADNVIISEYNNCFYIAVNGHVIARVSYRLYPSWAHDEPDTYPRVQPRETVIVKNGNLKHGEQNVAKVWEKLICLDDYRAAVVCENVVHNGHKCTMIDAPEDRVMVNRDYLDAIRQATRCRAVFASVRTRPVWFYDTTEIYSAPFRACIMPVNYHGPWKT